MATPHRALAPAVGLLVVLVTSAASAAAQGPAAMRDTLLANDLHVIVLPNPTIPVATLEVVIRAGAFTQLQPADEGIPHVLEHMLFKTYRGGEGFGPDANEAGATYNGTTSDERVTYYVTLPSENVERGIQLLAELVRDPQFDSRSLEAERLVVRGELQRMASDPYSVQELIANMVLWGPGFRRKNAIGNVNTIMTAETGRLRAQYRRYYVPNNAAVIASGDVRAEDVFRWTAQRFSRWERGADPFVEFEAPRFESLVADTAFVLDMPSSDVTFAIKWHGPSVSDDPVGTLAADVFSTMFNQAISGAQRRLVDSGVFQGVSISYQTLEHVGPITLMARTTPDKIERALTELGVELALLADTAYFDDDDLAAAKKTLLVGSAFERESGTSAAHTIATFWAIGGLDYYRAYDQGLQSVTSADVRAYLERYLIGRPRVVAVLATPELAARLSPVIHPIVRRQWPQVVR